MAICSGGRTKIQPVPKKVMVRYDLSAAEVDVLLFLANNSQFDLAVDIVRVRKMQKSHVSLAVNKLCEKDTFKKKQMRRIARKCI